MESIYRNKTILTLDMYREGISSSYKSSHKILRAVSFAYAIIMIFIAYVFLYLDWIFAGIFFVLAVVILFWDFFGYKIGTKKSFINFAKLHESHYQVLMEYDFCEEGLKQETSKTELFVRYDEFDIVYDTGTLMIVIFSKKVIIIDKLSFVDCTYGDVIKLVQDKGIRVKKI